MLAPAGVQLWRERARHPRWHATPLSMRLPSQPRRRRAWQLAQLRCGVGRHRKPCKRERLHLSQQQRSTSRCNSFHLVHFSHHGQPLCRYPRCGQCGRHWGVPPAELAGYSQPWCHRALQVCGAPEHELPSPASWRHSLTVVRALVVPKSLELHSKDDRRYHQLRLSSTLPIVRLLTAQLVSFGFLIMLTTCRPYRRAFDNAMAMGTQVGCLHLGVPYGTCPPPYPCAMPILGSHGTQALAWTLYHTWHTGALRVHLHRCHPRAPLRGH